MKVFCTNCRLPLADVTVLIPFGMQISCGECGANFGLSAVLETAPEASAPVTDPKPAA